MPETPGYNNDPQRPAAPQAPQPPQSYAAPAAQPYAAQQPYAAPAAQPYAAQQGQQQAPYGQYYANAAQQTAAAYAQQQAYSAAAAQPVKKSKFPWIAAMVCVFVAVFGFTISALSCSHAFTSSFGSSDDFEATQTFGDTVAVIDIAGTIQYDGTSCSPEGLRSLLIEAENNPDIKAVVLRVNSGGGVATAGEEMADLIKNFSKPVVVSSAGLNASAAYEISSQADYIFVNRTTEIGAIGTVLQITDMSGLYDMLGIRFENIASAESKDSSYGTRPLTDEEREYYQELVNDINEAFLENVAAGRGMDMAAVRELATGMLFSGEQAVDNGLADEVGNYDDALDYAASLGGISGTYDVVPLTSTFSMDSLLDLLGSSASDATVEDLLNALAAKGAAK